MTVSFAPRVASRWSPAAGLTVRGTVVVLPGRGEHGEVYERLGRRLAYDAYEVLALDALPSTPLSELVGVVHSLEVPATPLVLLGSDTGALEALQIAVLAGDLVQAVIAAGVPGEAASIGWDAELDARTACPVHRARLSSDDRFDREALRQPVPEQLTRPHGRFAGPVLVLHGSADRLSSVDHAAAVASSLPQGQLAVVEGGRHDVLNDLAHRSVAAEIVQFLERVRVSEHAPLIVRRAT
jgi:alpha-beta hydrolase superfamily lysophospholipase